MHQKAVARIIEGIFNRPLITNSFRGLFVEAMIAEALEPDWAWVAADWASYDFRSSDGVGLEVKQAALRQSWTAEGGKPAVPRFDIQPRSGRYEGALWIDAPGRAASLYIFAVHPVFEAAIADHRDFTQWEFYVVASKDLPSQNSIGLKGVQALAPSTSFDQLGATVRSVKQTIAAG